MKNILIIALLSIAISSCGDPNIVKKDAINKLIDNLSSGSENYPEKNTELSDFAKSIIMSGDVDKAERTYMLAYNFYKDTPDRQIFIPGSLSLYQLFLIYIDKHNRNRDAKKAEYYLNKLEAEFPNSEYSAKSRKLFESMTHNK